MTSVESVAADSMTGTATASPVSVPDLLAQGTARRPDAEALVIDGRRMTFRELQHSAEELAAALVATGLAPGEKVGILAPNSVGIVQAYFAASMAGAVVVPLSHRHKPDELRYAVGFADVAVLLVVTGGWRTDRAAADLVREALPEVTDRPVDGRPVDGLPLLRAVVSLDGTGEPGLLALADLPAPSASDREEVRRRRESLSSDQPAMIMFTSGTTSRPKGVVQTHGALAHASLARWSGGLLYEADERVWVPTPIYHSGALILLLGTLGNGFTFLTSSHFDGVQDARLIADEKITTLWPQFAAIIQDLDDGARDQGLEFPHVRQVAVVQVRSCFEQTARLFPNAELWSGYGSTEVNAFVTMPTADVDLEHRLATCGWPFDGVEVATFDPVTGAPMAPGEIGEIAVRGKCLFSGYYKDPDATRAAIDDDGWFHTGDLGTMDPTGAVALAGRKKDFLKVGGNNVSPAEIEAVALDHPAVRVAEVVGAPDQRLDEVPVAFVEVEPGAAVAEEELIDYCRARLASYKVPRRVFWIEPDGWPMSLTKIDKNALRSRIPADLGVPGAGLPGDGRAGGATAGSAAGT